MIVTTEQLVQQSIRMSMFMQDALDDYCRKTDVVKNDLLLKLVAEHIGYDLSAEERETKNATYKSEALKTRYLAEIGKLKTQLANAARTGKNLDTAVKAIQMLEAECKR